VAKPRLEPAQFRQSGFLGKNHYGPLRTRGDRCSRNWRMKSGSSVILAHLFLTQTRHEQNEGNLRAYGMSIFPVMFLFQVYVKIIFLYANRRICKTIFPC
jgi:hypothetical protein